VKSRDLEFMESCSIPTAPTINRIDSVDAKAAAQTARQVNEYAADLLRSHPGRFGFFAVIPLPDIEGSLREIDYAFAVLKADGIGLMTSYDDKWLGNSAYEHVFEELNRRKAVVFVHPTTGLCCRTLLPDINPIMLEIPQDTTRAVTNLLFSGTFTKFKDIRFIFTHAGGNVPMVLGRIHQYSPKNTSDKAPNGIECELKRLYYDVAGPLTDRRLQPSRVSSQPHRFCSAATILSSPSLRPLKGLCNSAFR
jgi:6-methylsalicylate decarboxylase